MVDLIDLYSKNSDGTNVTLERQRSWAENASSHSDSGQHSTHLPHAVSRRLGADARVEIIRRYGAGETAKVLAEEHDVARSAILNLLRANGVVVRRQPPTDAQKQHFSDEYEAGATIAEIAKRTGFSFGCVQNSLHAAGVRMRPRGKRVTSIK